MIAVDTSSLIAFFAGSPGEDVEVLASAMERETVFLPPVVVSEILSDSKLPGEIRKAILGMTRLPLKAGFWERAGLTRASVLKTKHKSRLADVLIAQSCIDSGAALISRDKDFRHYEAHGLKLKIKVKV